MQILITLPMRIIALVHMAIPFLRAGHLFGTHGSMATCHHHLGGFCEFRSKPDRCSLCLRIGAPKVVRKALLGLVMIPDAPLLAHNAILVQIVL